MRQRSPFELDLSGLDITPLQGKIAYRICQALKAVLLRHGAGDQWDTSTVLMWLDDRLLLLQALGSNLEAVLAENEALRGELEHLQCHEKHASVASGRKGDL